jgi:hypothetical protein
VGLGNTHQEETRDQQVAKMGHRLKTEVAVQQATWKTLLDMMHPDAVAHNINGEDEADKYATRNALGGLLVHTRFFDIEKKAFTQYTCFMVITLHSTGLDGPVLTLTSDEVWGGDTLVHLSALQVIDMEDEPLIPVCGTVSSEYLSGQSPTPICSTILQTPLDWCMNGTFVFSVVSVPYSRASDDEITGWLGIKDPSEMQYHHFILLPASDAD